MSSTASAQISTISACPLEMTPLPILFAQWNTADGRFMVCRFARGLQCLSDAAVTKNQHAPRLPSGTPRECVTLSYVMRDEESGAVVLDPKTEDTTYLEEFQKVEVREAADREHSLQRGFAIGELGNQLKQERAWFPVAVRPGGRGWGSQLEQLARAAIEPPELCSVWYESRELPRQTEKSMLMDRVARHAERFKAKAPSGLRCAGRSRSYDLWVTAPPCLSLPPQPRAHTIETDRKSVV